VKQPQHKENATMAEDEGGRLGLGGSRAVWVGLALVAILVVVLVIAVVLLRDEDEAEALEVSDPWVRATIALDDRQMGNDSEMSPLTGAFMTIRNTTDSADRLIGASTDVADVVEIHETTIEDDVMRMRPVDGVEIPAVGSVELKPGGLHIMLLDVQRDLEPGQTVTLKLDFESGRSLVVDAPVRPLE